MSPLRLDLLSMSPPTDLAPHCTVWALYVVAGPSSDSSETKKTTDTLSGIQIVLVFVGAFVLGNAVLCIIFVVISYLAFLWYSLSYVPYARFVPSLLLPPSAAGCPLLIG